MRISKYLQVSNISYPPAIEMRENFNTYANSLACGRRLEKIYGSASSILLVTKRSIFHTGVDDDLKEEAYCVQVSMYPFYNVVPRYKKKPNNSGYTFD